MSRSVVNIDFIAEYKGAQKLTQAQKDMAHLREGVMKLGKAFVGVFAAHEIVKWGKESLQAFATNEKQVAILTNTLNNLGKGFAALSVNHFIDNLALASGKTKEELIPAFQGLFIATGDVTTAQNALKVAMDVSQGTGKDLAKVQVALAKGYLGNTTSLTRLGAGLDKATLKTGNMDLIMKKLAATFRGDAATAADSFQGKMDRLNVAVTEAKVNIGQGLVTALTELGGSNGFEGALKGILDFSKGISDATIGTERLIKIVGFFVYNTKGTNPITQMNEFNKANAKADMLQRQVYGGAAATKYQGEVALALAKSKLKVDQASAKAVQDAKKATADKLALERSSLSLKLAGSTADMQNIEIQAALQRGQTDQVNNVLLLQRAILTGNADEANILAQKVLIANNLVMDVNGNITALAGAKDPFKDWPVASQSAIDQLKKVADYLATIKDKTITITVNTVTTSSGGGGAGGGGGGAGGGAGSGGNDGGIGTGGGGGFTDSQNWADEIAKKIKDDADALIKAGGGFTDSQNWADKIAAQAAKDAAIVAAVNLTDPNAQASFLSGIGGGASIAQSLSGARYAAQAEAAYKASGGTVTINVNSAPGIVVSTTQDASTNGTAVTVNRNNPFGLYSAQ